VRREIKEIKPKGMPLIVRHKLIYEGPLQWRKDRGKTLDLHVVLLEHLLVFLTKTGPESGPTNQQKLQLKIHEVRDCGHAIKFI
jgi:hypothetical protein